ncbi:MAG: hypothetical protein EPO30_06090 [Lysobacteraceae bacterium]|nr:MAG: hypothetical protein EPO30_06090 [Xanthomonadaceae bacterium]
MDRLTATLLCLAAFSLAPVAHAQQHDMSQHAMHAPAAAQPAPMQGMMKMMDPDGDGRITAAEHAAAAKAMFEKADADKDGSLTHEEMMAAHASMGMGMGMGMHMQGHAMKDGKKMGCCCCDGEGGMKGCGMGDKADPVGKAMSGK